MYYVYIARCSDGTLYTGYTNDLKHRAEQHSNGTGAAYTRSRRPVRFVHTEEFETRSVAMKREYEIKHMNKREKELLIASIT